MNDVMKEAFRKAGLEGKQPSDKSRAKETPPGNRSGYAGPPPASRSGSTRTAAAGFILRDDYTRQAEQVIQQLRGALGSRYKDFTTSKIRNILAQVSEIYNDVIAGRDDVLSAELQGRIEYLKVRLVYECGRENVVRQFVDKAKLMDLLNNIGDSRENFKKFARYMEALVAYHRFLGGQD